MNTNIKEILKQKLDFSCPICFEDYNLQDKFPYKICKNYHASCQQCYENYFQKAQYRLFPQCPICREKIIQANIMPFPKARRILELIDETDKLDLQISQNTEQTSLELQKIQNENEQIKDYNRFLLLENMKFYKKSLYEKIWKHKYEKLLEEHQKMIQNGQQVIEKIRHNFSLQFKIQFYLLCLVLVMVLLLVFKFYPFFLDIKGNSSIHNSRIEYNSTFQELKDQQVIDRFPEKNETIVQKYNNHIKRKNKRKDNP